MFCVLGQRFPRWSCNSQPVRTTLEFHTQGRQQLSARRPPTHLQNAVNTSQSKTSNVWSQSIVAAAGPAFKDDFGMLNFLPAKRPPNLSTVVRTELHNSNRSILYYISAKKDKEWVFQNISEPCSQSPVSFHIPSNIVNLLLTERKVSSICPQEK